MTKLIHGTALAWVILAGCSMQDGAMAPADRASAEIRNSSGAVVGSATARAASGGLRIRVEGMNLSSGPHGAHIHTIGSCELPTFESAGGHWNPASRQHGKDNPAGMHMGDLPNMTVGSGGRGTVEYLIAGGSLAGLLDADGSAIVIHANADDYRTDPTGNSGGRIACGVFR